MRVTVQHTMALKEMPGYIENRLTELVSRLDAVCDYLRIADDEASEGRFVDASEEIDVLRQHLSIIDQNLEEVQSLCLSYEKIRIQNNTPEMPPEEAPHA